MKLTIKKNTLLALLRCQARSDVRYYLNGICFRVDGKVVSTDGYVLAYGQHENQIENEVIIAIDKLSTKQFEYAVINREENICQLYDENEVLVGVTMAKLIDGNYPDIDRLINRVTTNLHQNGVCQIGFNAGFLAKLEKIAKLFNPQFPAVKLLLTLETDACLCELGNNYEQMNVLVMPAKI
ncbi:hypothetical protein [Arsenophonus endosymbiont of Crataerina pallida]|uniref:hypothetical protein n=1 Tax=Arsenophonus endosymbiont of Crataerina pallida TaxID=3066235 RepID=UPI0030CD43C9